MLRACLSSVAQNCAALEHEVIVVDNASHDGSAEMVRAEFQHVVLRAENSNLGFAQGNNLAYGLASGEFIWLLNSDTEVLPGAAEALLQMLHDKPDCGAVASALIDARDGSVQRSCRTFPTPAALWAEATGLARAFPRSRQFGFYRMGDWSMRNARAVPQPMASSFLLRRTAIESVTRESVAGSDRSTVEIDRTPPAATLFDEQFPIFFNDVDLCWRLHEAGWQIWFCPDSHVRHWGGASTGQARPEMIAESHRSLEAFYRKHWRRRYSPLVLAPTLLMVRASGWWRVRRARQAAHRASA